MTMVQPAGAIELIRFGVTGSLDDGDLLDRFLAQDGELAERAFETLVDRHGSMVFRVCRSILIDRDDARDAVQATFLVLATRAGSLRRRESVGPWLHGVALRIARSERSALARRRAHERRTAIIAIEDRPHRTPDLDEIRPVVAEELGRLPDRLRSPIWLCDVEEMTQEEAADRLGLPVGTVKSRLSRGRARLRDRLTRRGLGPVAPAPILGRGPIRIPPALATEMARAAVRVARRSTAGIVPASVSTLWQGALEMSWKDSIRRGVVATALALLAAGLGLARRDPIANPVRANSRSPRVSRDEQRQVSHELRLCSYPDPSWRESFADRLVLVEFSPPYTVWKVSPAELRDLMALFQRDERANIVQAPKVTTFDGATATVTDLSPCFVPFDGPVKVSRVRNLFEVYGPDGPVDPGPKAELAPIQGTRIDQGLSARMTTTIGAETNRVRLTLDQTQIVETRPMIVPGIMTKGQARPSPHRVSVPEVVRSHLDGEYTIDEGASLLVSLGFVPGREGKASAESLLLLTPRRIILEAEEAAIGRPHP